MAALFACLLTIAAPAHAHRADPPHFGVTDAAYPGTLTLDVDATDLDRHIFRVRETIPVKPGRLTLNYPRWYPGHHAPNGQISDLTGLQFTGAGKPLKWLRDPLDIYSFAVDIPAGVTSLTIDFAVVTPVKKSSGRFVVTDEMLNLQWRAALLYPAGYRDSRINVTASVTLPDGFQFGTALETAATNGTTRQFKTVSLENLIDSPIFAGKYMKRLDLDPDAVANGRAPIFLNVMADTPDQLEITPEQLAAHQALATQATRLYGARHFAHYDFLLLISDRLGGIGLEHHQSSENGVPPGYFVNWNKSSVGRDLLPHEFTHSWNGKFRRGADMATPNTNVPMQDSLLWVYEGQTQFWGDVLAVRSGLIPQKDMQDSLANTAAWFQERTGREWRNLQDTTNAPIFNTGEARGRDWTDWQRGSDYYDEMVMVWLEADMLIRKESGGKRSLDDFARAFFGPQKGRADTDFAPPLTYRFEDVVATLNSVQPHDWRSFLRDRLDSHARPGLTGLENSGWRLAWSEHPNSATRGREERNKYDDFDYSLGINVNKDGDLTQVRWNSPAFAAGLTTADKLLAVDGFAYKPERLKAAITAAKTSKAPIVLLMKDGDYYKTRTISYSDGLRYPRLERIEGTEDKLSSLLAPKS
ncbi:M61 family metallopeptidase [soil metagenome]